MINRRSLLSFLLIACVISWVLFSIPSMFMPDQVKVAQTMQVTFALAMWGPGIAAIITTLFVEKQPLSSLRLNKLGPKQFYLWAWLLPPVLTVLTLGTTLLIGAGKFDPAMTVMREALSKAPEGTQLPSVQQAVFFQLLFAVTLAPLINVIFALGEELGWRGFLLPRLLPLGQFQAILVSGAIWGIWHSPAILIYGYNFPMHPYLGVLVMIVGCILLGALLSWLYLNTRSPWVAALAHGAVNASPGLAIFFLKPGYDTALGGLILGVSGWIPMGLFILWLVVTKRLPVLTNTEPAVA